MIKRLLLSLLLTCPLWAVEEYTIIGLRGASQIFRGYDAYIDVNMLCLDNRTVSSIDVGTNTWTSVGHGFTTGNDVYIQSSGTQPSPFSKWFGTQYRITRLTADTFRIYDSSSGAPIQVVSAGSGTIKVGTVAMYGCYESGNPPRAFLAGSLPAGLTSTWMYAYYTPNASPMTLHNSSMIQSIRFTATASATLGVATEVVEVRANPSGTLLATINVPITVATLTPVARGVPTSYPAIPNLVSWEQTMLYLGEKWCRAKAAPTETFSIYTDSQVWYYDGAWVYKQLANYSGDTEWNNCADNIAKFFKDAINSGYYTLGRPRGHELFTDGLKSFCATCDRRYNVAIETLQSANNSYHFRINHAPDDQVIREASYALETMLNAWRTTGVKDIWLQRTADSIMAMLETHYIAANQTYLQTFMQGLALNALIHYWERTGDVRVPYYVKLALDGMWSSSWKEGQKGMWYNPAAYGTQCWTSCQEVVRTMNAMYTSPYAWLWTITGDTTYRDRADKLFQYGGRQADFTCHAADSVCHATGHPFAEGDHVPAYQTFRLDTQPTWSGTCRYAVNVTTDTFQLATFPGGTPCTVTADGISEYIWILYQPFTATAVDDTFTATAHTIKAGLPVWIARRTGYGLPSGIAEWAQYFSVNVTTDTFQLSSTLGGAAINLTTDGGGVFTIGSTGSVVDGHYSGWSGKEYSQIGRMIYDYVRWRQGLPAYRP